MTLVWPTTTRWLSALIVVTMTLSVVTTNLQAQSKAVKRKAAVRDMARIPGGTFIMGTDASSVPALLEKFNAKRAEIFADELPQHLVRIDPFYLDTHEVTNRQFKNFIDKHPEWEKANISATLHNGKYLQDWNGDNYPEGKSDFPVVFVSWYAAVAYCQSQRKRLPTEAEWEFAARGGRTENAFPWGDEPPDNTRANYGASGNGAAVKVGSYPPNGYGLYDMAGNVWDYLADEWAKYPSTNDVLVDPVAGGDLFDRGKSYLNVKTRRVIRGGSWGGSPINMRVTYRDSHPVDGAGDHVGFRCAMPAAAVADMRSSLPDNPHFAVQKVADGVYAFIRKEPPSLWFNPNNGLIVGKKYAIVIDSNVSSEYTREVLAAVRKITDKPVKYVINTHWHEDHVIGNRVYRDAFPDVKFIGQRSTLTDLATVGAANRKGSIQNGRGFVDLLKGQIAKGVDLAGKPLSDEARAGYTSDIALISSYLDEAPNFQIIIPEILVDDRLELNDDGRRIDIMFLGRAHTAADLVVYLPKEKLVFSGDLTVFPVPLVGSTSYPLEYADTLEKLSAIDATTFVPGHGPIMHDRKYIEQMIALLRSIKNQVTAAVSRGETLEQTRKSVNLDEFIAKFCGDSEHKRFVFQNYVFLPATAAAYKQLTGK